MLYKKDLTKNEQGLYSLTEEQLDDLVQTAVRHGINVAVDEYSKFSLEATKRLRSTCGLSEARDVIGNPESWEGKVVFQVYCDGIDKETLKLHHSIRRVLIGQISMQGMTFSYTFDDENSPMIYRGTGKLTDFGVWFFSSVESAKARIEDIKNGKR